MGCVDGWTVDADGFWEYDANGYRIRCGVLAPNAQGKTMTSVGTEDFNLQRAMELLGQIQNDPMRRANGGPGVDGPGLFGLGMAGSMEVSLGDPCSWLEWLRFNLPGGVPGWLSCKNFKYLLLLLLFLLAVGAGAASRR